MSQYLQVLRSKIDECFRKKGMLSGELTDEILDCLDVMEKYIAANIPPKENFTSCNQNDDVVECVKTIMCGDSSAAVLSM